MSAGATLAACLVVAEIAFSAPAYASCAGPQPLSPHHFTGVVLSTTRDGREARVRTAAGTTVLVVGTPAEGAGRTTVDRSYQTGHWYEFSPGNAASPFRDNICSATKEIPSPRTAAPVSAPSTVPTAFAAHAGPAVWPWGVGAAGAGVIAMGGTLLVRRRRSGRAGRDPGFSGA